MSVVHRLVFAAFACILPFVVVTRVVARNLGRLASIAGAVPALVLVAVAWSFGELLGYVTGRPPRPSESAPSAQRTAG
jgi:hypothetical protein